MNKKRIVIALGGNALGNNLPEQYAAVQDTARAIADFIGEGDEVILCHGNGPQVGTINNAMTAYSKTDPSHPALTPLSVCVAMSQAYIGYDLQNALREELLNRGIKKNVATVLTQIRVEEDDPAFQNPTKPIGPFMTKEEADALTAQGESVMEDAGRGYRRAVASPKPVEVIEIGTIRDILEAGEIAIAGGGGGIPVVRRGNHLKGVPAVIDKDFASCLIAEELNADFLIILTAVEKVALNFGKPDEKWLEQITVDEARQYIAEGHFAPGSMLPKVQAGVKFAASAEGRTAIITLLQKARDGLDGKTGTRIVKN